MRFGMEPLIKMGSNALLPNAFRDGAIDQDGQQCLAHMPSGW